MRNYSDSIGKQTRELTVCGAVQTQNKRARPNLCEAAKGQTLATLQEVFMCTDFELTIQSYSMLL